MNIKINIDVTKLDKSHFFKGKKGTYCELIIWERDEPDQYGNEFTVQQGISKEARDSGTKGEFVGNGKAMQQRSAPARQSRPQQRSFPSGVPKDEPADDSDIPF